MVQGVIIKVRLILVNLIFTWLIMKANVSTNEATGTGKGGGVGGQGGQMPPSPFPPNDFSIAKVAYFDFTSRGMFLPNEYTDRVVTMLRC